MLQNIPQFIELLRISTIFIFDNLINHQLEHKEKQENGHLALLGNNASTFEESTAFMLSERKDLVSEFICLSSHLCACVDQILPAL